MMPVRAIVNQDDRLRLQSPAFSILPAVAQLIRAEILLPDMQRYTIITLLIFGLFRYSDIGETRAFAAISTGRPRRDLGDCFQELTIIA